MNKIILIGRLVREPETRYTGETAVARYTLAVDRKFKKDGDATVDFINCVAFGKAGEFADKYFGKGTKVAVVGRLQVGSYTNKDGQKVNTADVIVEEQEFAESKSNNQQTAPVAPKPITDTDGFLTIPDGVQEELPFN